MKNVQILVDGEVPESLRDIPIGAMPDCHTCPKPEIDPENWDTLAVWQYVRDQRDTDGFTGMPGPIQVTALRSTLDEMGVEGEEREVIFRRIMLLDGVYRQVQGEKLAAATQAKGATPAEQPD